MKLTLTIQEMTDPKTDQLYKGVFGSLILQKHKDELAEKMLDWVEKDKIYNEAIEKNEENNLIQPIKPEIKGINFAINLKSIDGLEEIINQLMTDAINLERKQTLEDMRKKNKARNEAKKNGVKTGGIAYDTNS